MCALFIFAVLAAPPAYAVGETVALFTAAAVLSSAVAALGFKLSTDAEGQATLSKMVEDFAKVSWATGLVIVGSRVNGLINGLNYIKMAVHNGKTYLDERVIAWCQQWLAHNGVYDSGEVESMPTLSSSKNWGTSSSPVVGPGNCDLLAFIGFLYPDLNSFSSKFQNLSKSNIFLSERTGSSSLIYVTDSFYVESGKIYIHCKYESDSFYYTQVFYQRNSFWREPVNFKSSNEWLFLDYISDYWYSSSDAEVNSSNDTGLTGTDTLGKDVVDLTLDQILEKLKEWAQDWYDAGADSATNEASGALDLPLTVTDGAATANPALNPDVVYNPPFSLPWPDVRSGETSSSTTEAGQANADAAQTATADVAENQTIVDSLVTWALGYISPDTGLFSKFPLCIPYDAYLIVCSALGVDAVDPSIVYGAEPGDLAGVVTSGTSTYSDFQPIIHLEHDFELDGRTYPLEITIDLTPWQPLVDVSREGIAILFLAELIASEYRRIKGH
nr:MAG TPA: hypothetical protein [Inoviridae sp.]